MYDPAVVRRALEGLRPFGNGGFGMVYRATIGGEQLAVKAFRRDTVNGIVSGHGASLCMALCSET